MALVAFTTFFATIGPVDVAALFAALTPRASAQERRAMAVNGVALATLLLMIFVIFGNAVLVTLGITLPAFKTAGGVLLLLLAIDMVFARHSGIASTTEAEHKEAAQKQDISVFPLATPLLAGPGALGAAVLLSAEAGKDFWMEMIVIGALLAVLAIALLLLLVATQVYKLLGVTGLNVISRVVGILLAALAVQFIFDGLRSSGIFG